MIQKLPTLQDIMTKSVISVRPDSTLLEAYELILKHNFDGLPVVDENNRLVGILTQYDFIEKESKIHIPTLQKFLSELTISQQETDIRKDIQELTHLTVRDIMNSDPFTLQDSASFEEVTVAFRSHHRVNPIPIVNKDNILQGIISRYDVVKSFGIVNTNS